MNSPEGDHSRTGIRTPTAIAIPPIFGLGCVWTDRPLGISMVSSLTAYVLKMGIKTIQFDDMNWDKNYHQNKTYSQSKLAQMMFAYELQDKLAAANRTDVEVYVCHPGSSRTSLITTSGNLATRIMFRLMSLSPMVQSAEKGAYPEVMCDVRDEPGWQTWTLTSEFAVASRSCNS